MNPPLLTRRDALSRAGFGLGSLALAGLLSDMGLTQAHAANLSLVTMCTMHLLRAIPNAGKYLEFSIEEEDYYPWQYGLFRGEPYAITDGKATVTDQPGWGVEIDPRWLDGAQYRVSEV